MKNITIKPHECSVMIYRLDHEPPHIHVITEWREYEMDIDDDDPLMRFEDVGLDDFVPEVSRMSDGGVHVTFEDGTTRRYPVKSAIESGLIGESLFDIESGEEITEHVAPTAKSVTPLPDKVLQVTFEGESARLYDVKPLMGDDAFKGLANDDLFRKARLSPGGFAVIWSDDIDLAIEEVWFNGRQA